MAKRRPFVICIVSVSCLLGRKYQMKLAISHYSLEIIRSQTRNSSVLEFNFWELSKVICQVNASNLISPSILFSLFSSKSIHHVIFQFWKYPQFYNSVLNISTILYFSFESIHYVIFQFWKYPLCYNSVLKVSTMLHFSFESIHHFIFQFWKYPPCYNSVLKVSNVL